MSGYNFAIVKSDENIEKLDKIGFTIVGYALILIKRVFKALLNF